MLDHPVIHIGLESVFFPRDHMGKLDNTQLVFAEFWLNADGDSVFFDLIHKYVSGEYPVMYYSHEDHPPRIKKLADSFSEFINHCFEYEEWW